MEVVTMIYRPLYVDKIMAYADTPDVYKRQAMSRKRLAARPST